MQQPDNRVEPLWDLSFLPGYVWLIIIFAVVALFLCMLYFAICGFTALRGWRGYASRHRGPDAFPAGVRTFAGQSIMIGGKIAPANYRNVVSVGLGGEGIHLRMSSFFRAFHPPLLVPWDAVQNVSQNQAIVGSYTAVECRSLPRLVFFEELGDAVFARWQARHAAASPQPDTQRDGLNPDRR